MLNRTARISSDLQMLSHTLEASVDRHDLSSTPSTSVATPRKTTLGAEITSRWNTALQDIVESSGNMHPLVSVRQRWRSVGSGLDGEEAGR